MPNEYSHLSDKVIRKRITRRANSGNYFPFFELFLDIVSHMEALVLQKLSNLSDMNEDANGWFRCSILMIQKSLRMDERVQNKYLTRLKDLGFIKTCRRGMPAVRYIQVCWEAIDDALDAVQTPVVADQNARSGQDQKNRVIPPGGLTTTRVRAENKKLIQIQKSCPEPQTSLDDATGGDPVCLFGEDECPSSSRDKPKPQKRKHPTEFDKAIAERLKTIIQTSRHLTIRKDMDKWADQIRILRERLTDNAEERIAKAIEWYAANVKDQWTPKCDCAASFNSKFGNLELAIARSKRDRPAESVVVGDKAKLVYSYLEHRPWPKGSKAQVPAAAQLSLDFLSAFLKKVYALNKASPDKRVRYMATDVIAYVPDPVAFVVNFLRDVLEAVQDWDGWSGNLMKMGVLSATNSRFLAWGRGRATKCGIPESEFDRLLEAVDAS